MSAEGHSRRFGDVRTTSALPPKADSSRTSRHVRKVPTTDLSIATQQQRRHSTSAKIGLLLKPELADPPPDGMFPAALKEGTMAEAKLAPNLPDWMVEHANRYLASGGTDGHMYKTTVPQRGEITAPALLLTTTGRKSGDKFIFPLFYGMDGDSCFVIASKGGAPQHPGWYRNILANPDVEVQVATKKINARARTTEGEERLRLWKKALEFWPPYADYQLKTEREIPVVVLDPVH